jgi:2-oxoisovalerate dehydrogenase E1 component alpha subunit
MARLIAIEQGRPSLIEAMTYRVGAHSTSDDDSKYRRLESPEPGFDSERAYWDARSPIIRFGSFLETLGLWSAEEEEALRKVERARSIKALNDAEKVRARVPPMSRNIGTMSSAAQLSRPLWQRSSVTSSRLPPVPFQVAGPHVKHLFTDVYDEMPWMLRV